MTSWRGGPSLAMRNGRWSKSKHRMNSTKLRKSDVFKKDLPEEKVKEFGGILKKFFDSEAADYKKDGEAKTPDYDGLKKRAGQSKKELKLTQRIVEVNRDAGRRYQFARSKILKAERNGEYFPQSSPLTWNYQIPNADEEDHKLAVAVIDEFKKVKDSAGLDPAVKKYMEEWIEKGVPPQGKVFDVYLPVALVDQMKWVHGALKNSLADAEDKEAYMKKMPELFADTMGKLQNDYVSARDEVQMEADEMKAFFKSQKDVPGATKADVAKEIWEVWGQVSEKPLPPMDEDTLAELAKYPAVIEGEFQHSWGTADKLYKSEAIDPFGQKYLLGIFETKKEAAKAFKDWNAEYEKARVDLKDELAQWSKQEQARLDKDTIGQERIKDILSKAGGR
mmetsp:Transcript_31325/g.48594  ORF Transcript_31325/g.48594 Transcript_31325/m.48594 type:complete len:392 (+) Transcript_31325:220-1395(+)